MITNIQFKFYSLSEIRNVCKSYGSVFFERGKGGLMRVYRNHLLLKQPHRDYWQVWFFTGERLNPILSDPPPTVLEKARAIVNQRWIKAGGIYHYPFMHEPWLEHISAVTIGKLAALSKSYIPDPDLRKLLADYDLLDLYPIPGTPVEWRLYRVSTDPLKQTHEVAVQFTADGWDNYKIRFYTAR